VLIIPPPPANLRSTPPSFSRILVPTDFSASAAKALPYASAFVHEFNATLHLLHVVEPPRYPVFGYARVPMQEARACRAARETLARLCVESPLTPLLRVRTHVRTGNAALEIATTARTLRSDLIVMTTHGRTALAHAFLGSTSEKTVRHAPCPLLLVRQKQHECIQP
jgi:nucleotide-binding universal stress UspA family protein